MNGERGKEEQADFLPIKFCTSGLAWQGVIYRNAWLNCGKDCREVFLLPVSRRKGGGEITRASSTFPANGDAVSNATHSVIKASCVFRRKLFGMRKFRRGQCAGGPLDCLNWSLFQLYFVAYFCVVSQFPTQGPSLFLFREKKKKNPARQEVKVVMQTLSQTLVWALLTWFIICKHCPCCGPCLFSHVCQLLLSLCQISLVRTPPFLLQCRASPWDETRGAGASKVRTTSRWSPVQTHIYHSPCPCEIRAPRCLTLGTYPVEGTFHPQKWIFTTTVWESWVWIHSGFYLKCSAVRQEWRVNSRWWPTLILTSIPLVFRRQERWMANNPAKLVHSQILPALPWGDAPWAWKMDIAGPMIFLRSSLILALLLWHWMGKGASQAL